MKPLRLATSFASVSILIALAPAVAQSQGHGCAEGAAGLGDRYFPTYGNGGYDVRRYDLDVVYRPATDRLRGRASIRARAKRRLCSFNLDFVGLEVGEVKVDRRQARWRRDDHELTVLPARPLKRGERFEVVVRYAGVPVGSGLSGFMRTEDGANVAGQPEAAATWFPVNDHPLDKASYSFDVTVPNGYEVVANGRPRGRDRSPGGMTTWRWRAGKMASYLATIDVGEWDVRRWRTEGGIPVYDAVDSALTGGLRDEIDSSLARQEEMLDVLTPSFGPYPFNALGGIVDNQSNLFFALETQTRPVYSKYFWLNSQGEPTNGDFVVVHELAHQWFGDDVALARWRDIWLNEGFATYAEWLWTEDQGGPTPRATFQQLYDAIPTNDPFWSLRIGDPGADRLFDDEVYVRGAMAAQALRNEIGRADFFRLLRKWTSSKSGGNGTTGQFIALAEQVSGEQLDDLFEAWLYTPAKPETSQISGGTGRGDARRSAAGGWLEVVQQRLRRHGRY